MSLNDLSKLPPQVIDLLRRIHSGEYDSEHAREALDDLLERRADADRIPSMTDAEVQAYLSRPLKFPKCEPWLTWCLEHKPPLVNSENGVHWLTDFGHIALEIADAATLAGQPEEQTRPHAEGEPDDSPRLSLTDNEYTVLRALRDKLPRRVLLADLSADTGIDRKVCGAVVTSLIRSGLAERPSPRKGATIAPAGKRLLKDADATRHHSVDSR